MRGGSNRNPSTFTRAVNSVFTFVRYAEFEILFVLFFLIAFIIFKDLCMDLRLKASWEACLSVCNLMGHSCQEEGPSVVARAEMKMCGDSPENWNLA
ncbi:hypothetical protein CK203_037619 [Vitis vinifera]|uniref:Uncharacterized protein n=1 Tax=Vitis vinifera TaxID=29760 RepID=A0A438HKW9_VITVI|nr:hypothetical protein CK203_110501 [Vitis vinifera]RVW85049.1 hypothetical protein CK203_037619 [Vitis vinifera]